MAGDLALLSQDEARFSMVPTLRTTLGLKGQRPIVGHLDCHDGVYVFGGLNLVTGHLTTRLVERLKEPRKRRASPSRGRCLQAARARYVGDIGRAYPAAQYPRVVLVIDNAPWHKGALLTAVLRQQAHLELYRWPSYSPQLQVIERLWKVLRRRATHNRVFMAVGHLKRA